MSRQVRYLRRAELDVRQIAADLERETPLAAPRILDALLARIDLLTDRGSVPRDERLRRAGYRFVRSGRYLVTYKATPHVVRIHRVLHHRRAYDLLLR